MGRLTSSTAKKGNNTQIEKLTYTYGGTRITQRREQSSLPGITALDETRSYAYDGLGRLTSSTAGTSSAQYTYDAAGNQTSEDTGDMYRERYYNSLDQLSWESVSDYIWYEDQIIDYYYDGRGNMDSALDEEFNSGMIYDYHADGTMSQMHHRPGRDTGGWNLTQTMKYDHNGIRTEKAVGSDTIHYYYAEGKPVLARSSAHTATSLFDGEEIIGAYHGSTWYDYLTDQQGSVMGILKQDGTTAAAYSYSDFGETTARHGETFNNEICYTGAVYDSDFGEYYLNARYYDPATSNFLSQDTYRGDTGDYGQWNLYAYCANDPINCIDLTGHGREWEKKKVYSSHYFKDIPSEARAYDKGEPKFSLVNLVLTGAGFKIKAPFFSRAIAICGVSYQILDYQYKVKNKKLSNYIMDYYEKYKEEYEKKKIVYMTKVMKRLSTDEVHKRYSEWSIDKIKLSKVKPSGFKDAKFKQ